MIDTLLHTDWIEMAGWSREDGWYWLKGHHDRGAFAASVNREWDGEWTAEDVRYGWFRYECHGPDRILQHVDGSDRGAFEATFIAVGLA